MTRVLLVDDNEVYRSSLELLLGMQEGIEIAGAAATAGEAEMLVATLDPDLVLLDFRLPDLNGAAAAARLRAIRPGLAILCLTAEATPAEGEAVIAAGAAGLVEKGVPVADLAAAVRAAAGATV